MKNTEPIEFLDDKQWSALWEYYLTKATVFDPFRIHEINCILPLPDTSGVLIFTDDEVYFSSVSALKTLHQFASIHSFSDYQVLSICLKNSVISVSIKCPGSAPTFPYFL